MVGAWAVRTYAQAYVLGLSLVYISCYLRQASAGGESFDCNVVEHKNVTHSVSKLKFASLNAEWLFDGKDDPSYSPWYPGKTSCPGKEHCGTEEGAQVGSEPRASSVLSLSLSADPPSALLPPFFVSRTTSPKCLITSSS